MENFVEVAIFHAVKSEFFPSFARIDTAQCRAESAQRQPRPIGQARSGIDGVARAVADKVHLFPAFATIVAAQNQAFVPYGYAFFGIRKAHFVDLGVMQLSWHFGLRPNFAAVGAVENVPLLACGDQAHLRSGQRSHIHVLGIGGRCL